MRAKITRRGLLGAATLAGCGLRAKDAEAPRTGGESMQSAATRELGRTGVRVEAVSLGGEGVLRTRGRSADAVPVVLEALNGGVRYCDTAPAYDQSQDYYGQAFRALPEARSRIFLASKTHERDRDGALALLDQSLRRLGTDRLDLWQMHDLRTKADLDAIFGKGGAMEAAEQAKREGKIRFVGVTGHHDPDVLLEALRRHPFDAVLLPVNPADPARRPFITTVIPAARERGAAIIGMKVMAHGMLVADGVATAEQCIRYAMAHADTLIIGCSSPEEVRENLRIGRTATPMSRDEQLALESRVGARAAKYAYFKA
jgi:aryl-alcohol dehydrogenase-like predicted oxidoreductase